MTSYAVTLKAIDAALLAKYSGISINTGNPPASTAVTPFIEDPDPEEYTERVFPSVSIKMLSLVPDYFAIVDSEDLLDEEISYDAGASPPVSTRRQRPLPYRVQYSIDTWHRERVSESRDLLIETILYRTNPRGYLTVQNVDGVNVDVWMIWDGGVTSMDFSETDEIIYRKSLTVYVLAYLALVDASDTSEEKVATELNFEVQSRHTYLDSNGEVQVDDSKNVKDVEIRVTDTDVEVIP